MANPPVSVLISTYNQQEYAEEAILSAVEQDYDNLEVIVVDDASRDNSAQIIKMLAGKYPGRIRPLFNAKNAGVSNTKNRALSASQGKYIAHLDGDDLFLPGKIKRQVEFMRRHDYVFSYHDFEVFEARSEKTSFQWSSRFPPIAGGAKELLRYGSFTGSPSIMFEKRFVPDDGFGRNLAGGSEWYLWIRILEESGREMGYIDEVLAKHRRHASNDTLNWDNKLDDQLILLDLLFGYYPHLTKEISKRRADLYFMQGARSLVKKQWLEAGRSFSQSITSQPPLYLGWLRILWREGNFLLRRALKPDDLIDTFVARKDQ